MAAPPATIRSFHAPLRGPGRTAPLLLEDLHLFDPTKEVPADENILADGPRTFSRVPFIGQLIPPGSCTHEFCTKPRQSVVPLLDERPTADTLWQIAAVCQHCRIHLLLQVDFRAAWQAHPCPSYRDPLHHLVKSTWRQDLVVRESSSRYPYSSGQVHVYECSASQCAAVVTVHLVPPALSEHDLHILLDPELLRQRTDAAFASSKGSTEGMVRPTALDVLSDLRAYLRNSWHMEQQARISLDNKRFVVRFGPGGKACAEVLKRLGFELTEGEAWASPQPDRTEHFPIQSEINVYLDNVEAELNILVANRPAEERLHTHDQTKLEPAWDNLRRALGAQNYDKTPLSRTKARTRSVLQRPRAFTVLGIPDDASDDLIIWAYKRQMEIEIDPRQGAHYVTALEDVQKLRQSEKLGEQVAIEWSQGRYGEQSIADAYKTLGLSQSVDLADDTIIGTYNARLQDAPSQGPAMREALGRIGHLKNSQRLISYSRNDLSTYDDALDFLEATNEVDDNFIVSMYTAKIADSASDQEMAQRALRIIAEHRGSVQLRDFINQGYQADVAPVDMDIGDAYKLLSIGDRTVDDDTVWMVYNIHCVDHSDETAKALQAITTIAKQTNSRKLKEYLGLPLDDLPVQRIDWVTEPVGLENIGNTCYLNSLLQSLYTIVPVRDIVLNCDQYWQDPDLVEVEKKRTGQRLVLRREVLSAQRFVRQLAELFQAMKESSDRAIKPSQELARLTLDTASLKERRSSTLKSTRRPTLGMIDSRPIIGPLPPPTEPETVDAIAVQPPRAGDEQDAEKQLGNNSSIISHQLAAEAQSETSQAVAERSSTINSEPILLESPVQNGSPLTEGNDHREHAEGSVFEIHNITTSEPTAQQVPFNPIEMAATATKNAASEHAAQRAAPIGPKYEPPEGKPPPVPPRPTSVAALEAYARQQDVTEVLGHAIFQLSCAIRARGSDELGEQQDEIHDTFFGVEQVHVLQGNASPKPPVQFLFLYLPIYNNPKDLYAAIDNEFDPEERGSSEVYNTIAKLPPVLCMQLGRTGADNRKLDNHVQILPTIYMDRYMDAPANSTLVHMRSKVWMLRKELKELRARIAELEPQGKPAADQALDDAVVAIKQLQNLGISEASTDLLDALGEISQLAKQERQTIHNRIEIVESTIFDTFNDDALKQEEYQLHAAFFHRGTMGSGHYFVYIFDHAAQAWRKYNDEYISQVSNLKDIYGNPENDPTNSNWTSSGVANPYFLLYVRTNRTVAEKSIVQTVLRDPQARNQPVVTVHGEQHLRPLGTDPNDTEMHDSNDTAYANQPSQMSYLPPAETGSHDVREMNEWEQVNFDHASEVNAVESTDKWTPTENKNVPQNGW